MPTTQHHRLVIRAALACLLLQPLLFVPLAEAQVAASRPSELVTLNFVNADIESVVGAIGQMTGRTFLVDPRVRGTVTLSSSTPVPRDEAFRMLLSALRLQGFSVVEDGKYAKVVPEADAKLQSGRVEQQSITKGDQIVTQVFRLQYESANNLVPVLRPLIAPNNTITAYAANNTLVITDYADNLRRLGQIIATIDTPQAVDLEVIPLKHAVAIDIASMVNKLLEDKAGGPADAGQRVTLLADQRSNTLLLRAGSRARADIARTIIERLDQPGQRGGNINVVYLKNANAVQLAQTLRAILTGEGSAASATGASSSSSLGGGLGASSSSASGQGASSLGGAGSASTAGGTTAGMGNFSSSSTTSGSAGGSFPGGSIQADPATNTLIITAPDPVYRNVRDIIEKLDVRRAQVMIETLIVEVNANDAAEFGVQWQALGGLNNTGTQVVGGTNFSGTGSGTNILSTAQNLTSVGTGLNVGVIRGSVTVAGQTITNIGLLARALETSGKGNILSTPNVLTLDNQQATFVSGQNVPFLTGSYSNGSATTGASVNPFQTIERKDVGLTLKVKPQISEGGVVNLQIYQEQSSVQSNTAQGLITNKRAIDTTVLVDNGSIVVLGGLIEDTGNTATEGVPGLSRIPLIGGLFRYERRDRKKTNLMVFLRPYIIRDTATENSVVLDRYDYMRLRSGEAQPPANWLLPDMPSRQPAPLDAQGTVAAPKLLVAPPEGAVDAGVAGKR